MLIAMVILAAGELSWSEIVSAIAGGTVPALVTFIRRLRKTISDLLDRFDQFEQQITKLLEKAAKVDHDTQEFQARIAKLNEEIALLRKGV